MCQRGAASFCGSCHAAAGDTVYSVVVAATRAVTFRLTGST
jgi:hypothetical protein